MSAVQTAFNVVYCRSRNVSWRLFNEKNHHFVLYRDVHIRWCPEVSKAVESSEKRQCSDLIIAVGPNAAGKSPFSPLVTSSIESLSSLQILHGCYVCTRPFCC